MHSAIKVAYHFVDKANKDEVLDMTPLKLMKVTFIAHGWMLAIHDRPLVSEDVEAWQYGPVIPEMYRETKRFGRKHIDKLPENYKATLDDEERIIVEQVAGSYSTYTAGQLVALTHKEGTPWDEVTRGGQFFGMGLVIPNSKIGAYYKELAA